MPLVQNGSLRLGKVNRVPVLIHWTWPLGMLWLCGGFRPVMWAAFAFIVLVHEFGHAFWVRRFRLRVSVILVHGFGGECRYRGDPSSGERAVIAWGGVMAQAIVLFAALAVSPFVTTAQGRGLCEFFIWSNLWMIGFNLLPIAPLDGAEAWKYPVIWWRARRELTAYLRERKAKQRERDAEVARTRARREEIAAGEIERREREVALDGTLPAEIEAQLDSVMKRPRPKK